jgi:AcrR family transcriptional regulator
MSAPDSPEAAAKPATRQRLIDAAFVVIARAGLQNASVKAIAAQARLTPGLTHYHFPTLDALHLAALRQGLDSELAEVRRRRENTPPYRQIEALFGAAREAPTREADRYRVRLAFAVRAFEDPEVARLLNEFGAAVAVETARALAAARGGPRPDGADEELAATLRATFDGFMLAWLNDPKYPIQAAVMVLERAVRQSLRR